MIGNRTSHYYLISYGATVFSDPRSIFFHVGRGAETWFHLGRDGDGVRPLPAPPPPSALRVLDAWYGPAVSSGELRGAVTRWLFAPSDASLAHAALRRREMGLPPPGAYVSLHVRWGDKLNAEVRVVA